MTNPTALAAALNECMPLVVDDDTFVRVRVHCGMTCWMTAGHVEHGGGVCIEDTKIIGILWAECVRRGWPVAFHVDPPEVVVWPYRGNGRNKIEGNDALAFARVFAAAKRAEGGGV